VQDLDDETARQYGYKQAEGVVITEVAPASPAARRQIFRGETILEIKGAEIAGTEDVRQALSQIDSGEIVQFILGNPDGGSRIVNVRMPGN